MSAKSFVAKKYTKLLLFLYENFKKEFVPESLKEMAFQIKPKCHFFCQSLSYRETDFLSQLFDSDFNGAGRAT